MSPMPLHGHARQTQKLRSDRSMTKKSVTVVFDTNIVLSALLFANGRLMPLRSAWQQGQCLPLISKATITEVIRVLTYPKFKLTEIEQQELLADYVPYCKTVRIPAKLPKLPICRDSYDQPFIELASAGKAEYLVSGDNDLLCIEKVSTCRIVSAEQFLSQVLD